MVKTNNIKTQSAEQIYHPQLFIIKEKIEHNPDCYTLVVTPKEKNTSASFLPGQFFMLYAFGKGEVPISISGNPYSKNELSFTISNVGSVSAALCGMRVGETVGLRGPFGNFWPLEKAKNKRLIMVAGGLGLAPLRPIVHHALQNKKYFEKSSLIVGARAPDSILYTEQHKQWSTELNIATTVDNPTPNWRGRVGLVTELIKDENIDAKNSIAMICGPEGMMRFSAQTLLDKGMSSSDIYISMERNMKCAIGHCGRCQYGPYFICKDGPIFAFSDVEHLFNLAEV